MKVYILFSQKDQHDPVIISIYKKEKDAHEDANHFRERDEYRLFYVEDWDVVE